MDISGISIVIPAYNEASGVPVTLSELVALMEGIDAELPWEILVVDDGSTDDTAAAVEPYLGERVHLLKHEKNRGYGASLKTGVHHARHPWILITDADGTYPSRYVPQLLEHREQYEMVVGSRTGRETHIPLLRRPAKWFLTRLASYLSETEIPDLNSGLRIFPKAVADRFQRLLPNGFSYTSTITLAMLSSGYEVKYVPIDYRKRRGGSKIRPFRDTVNFIQLIVRTVMFFDPMRVLLPMAGAFVLASLLVGVGSVVLTGRLMDVTTVVLFVSGVQILALGMIADAINRRLP